jgi:hypothetical protein
VQSYAQTYLGYSEIFGQRPTQRFLELRFGHLPQIATLRLMTGLAAIYYNGAANTEGNQSRLLRELAGNVPWVARASALLDAGERVLFHDELYAGMAKMALRFAPRDDRAVPADFGVRIAECALMYSELLGIELLPRVSTGTVEDLLAAELRSIPRNRDHRLAIVGRYVAFIDWMRSGEPAQYGWTRSIDDDFQGFYGLTLDDYLAACVLFGHLYSAMQDVAALKKFDPIVDVRIWFAPLNDRTFLDIFVDRFAIPSADLVAQWNAEPNTSLSLAALGPLWNRPLVRLDDVHVVAPLPPLLYNAAGEGLYYNIFDRYDNATKATFSQCFGYFLQDYVRRIFDAAYAGIANCIVDGDVLYGKHGARTTDSVIFEGDDVIFVEVVGKRVNLKGAVLDLDEASIRSVLEAGVRKKLKQLHTNVEAYRAGKTFADRPRPAGQRIFAMIVTPVSYPHLYVATKYIPQVTAEENWLGGVASIEIADIEEIEMLEDSIPGGFRLAPFLEEKARTAHGLPLKNALIARDDVGRGEPAIARGADFVKTVSGLLKA